MDTAEDYFQISFEGTEIFIGTETDVEAYCGPGVCGCTYPWARKIAAMSTEICVLDCTILHEFGHLASWISYHDPDYAHARYSDWYQTRIFEVCL